MRFVLWTTVLMLALSATWRYRDLVTAPFAAAPAAAKPVVFDNGSVRDHAPAAPLSLGAGAAVPAPAGALRKCVKGGQTTYTNFVCPAGFDEKAVSADRMNVLTDRSAALALPAAAPGPGPGAEPAAPGARKRLHDALDFSRDDGLKQRVIDRAVEQSTR